MQCCSVCFSAFLANVLDLICSNTYAVIFPVLRYYICLEGKPAPLCIVQSKQVRQPRKFTQLPINDKLVDEDDLY